MSKRDNDSHLMMNLPLAKAEPISDGGTTSGITDLEKEYLLHNNSREERSETEKNSSANTKVFEEGGGGGAPSTRAEIRLQAVVKTIVRQLCPCSPWRSMAKQKYTCSR
ncbi:protein pxr1-like [Willisornis vidua]|uniref:Protein pxr1-like n=1 Tax=Willisornis vidua TaxID=1566151 RepID=A0ABQ9DV33_9PASS|nr:protein pxr1-like [Willisornis vidua]